MYEKIGYDFLPFAMELGGRYGKGALKVIDWVQSFALGEESREVDWTAPSFGRSFWKRHFQAIVQKANARHVMAFRGQVSARAVGV